MPTAEPRELFEKYAAAVAYVCTKDRDGDEGMGTAFHVGDGVFLTARHVVENRQILELATTTQHYVPDEAGNTHIGSERFRTVGPGSGHVIKGPLFHPDSDVDVAALVVNGLEELPVIPLGSHLDDWINDDAFLLNRVVVLGYPPIPTSDKPVLLASRGEVNAVVDKYTGPHPHFVVSVMSRGGFSGGPCISEWDLALGLITESLLVNGQPSELGYMAVLSVEPLYVCLAHHGILPACQKDWAEL